MEIKMAVKYVFVTGGVVSGLGKGITAASLGRLLKMRGYKVTMQKFDPYINIDPGTMNPIQHGEVFVTDDGAETDLDLGHYERFIDESLTKQSNVTTGKVYWSVLSKERRGDYGGGTVQVIPHITNELKSRFYRNDGVKETQIAIIEVGGTVGDIESQPFLEAIRQFQLDVGHENAILIHVTLVPYLKASQELKSKPTQASVKELQGMGIQPDIVVCRTEIPLDKAIRDKISLFCNVPNSQVIQNLDVETLYEVPLAMEKENLAQTVCKCLHLDCPEPDIKGWEDMVNSIKNLNKEVTDSWKPGSAPCSGWRLPQPGVALSDAPEVPGRDGRSTPVPPAWGDCPGRGSPHLPALPVLPHAGCRFPPAPAGTAGLRMACRGGLPGACRLSGAQCPWACRASCGNAWHRHRVPDAATPGLTTHTGCR